MTTHQSNGKVDEGAVADVLQEEATVGYVPTVPLESMWQSGAGDMPRITFRRDLELMQLHPVVSTALDYYRSGIAGAEFWGGPDHKDPSNVQGREISPDPHVAQFVLMHAERFWQRGMPMLQEGGYPYGWAPGEHIYKESGGMLVWSHLKVFSPSDGFILTYGGKPVGVRVKGIRDIPTDYDEGNRHIKSGSVVDLWLASESIPAKAAWYPHRPRFGQFYGRSQLLGAWLPWRMIGWRDGMDQVINAAVYRGGYRGPIVRHPPEDSQTAQTGIPATRADSRGEPRRSARDVARQIVEWAKAGAGFTLSSAQYPPSMGGGAKWNVEWPEHVMDVRPLIEAARWAEDRIMLGIGVPPELVKAGGTGSGYSGRSIPREAFLDGQQRVADAMLQLFVEQVIKPLVLWNFGPIPFNIQCKSLLKTQADDKSGASQPAGGASSGGAGQPNNLRRSQAAKDAWQLRKQHMAGGQKQPGTPQTAAPPTPAFSVESEKSVSDKVLQIIKRVMSKDAA